MNNLKRFIGKTFFPKLYAESEQLEKELEETKLQLQNLLGGTHGNLLEAHESINEVKKYLESGGDTNALEKLGEGKDGQVFRYKHVSVKMYKKFENAEHEEEVRGEIDRLKRDTLLAAKEGVLVAPLMDSASIKGRMYSFRPYIEGPTIKSCTMEELAQVSPDAIYKYLMDSIKMRGYRHAVDNHSKGANMVLMGKEEKHIFNIDYEPYDYPTKAFKSAIERNMKNATEGTYKNHREIIMEYFRKDDEWSCHQALSVMWWRVEREPNHPLSSKILNNIGKAIEMLEDTKYKPFYEETCRNNGELKAHKVTTLKFLNESRKKTGTNEDNKNV